MNKKQYATPLVNVVEMENEDMIALSTGNGNGLSCEEVGNRNQLVKDVELPSDLSGNRNLWDDKW